jgi:hypothetical protein
MNPIEVKETQKEPSQPGSASAATIAGGRNQTMARQLIVDLEAEALTITAGGALSVACRLRSSGHEQGAIF